LVLIQPGGDLDGAELTLIFYPKSFKCRGLFKVVVFSLEAEKKKKSIDFSTTVKTNNSFKEVNFFF